MHYMLMIIADETRALPPAAELSKLAQDYREFTEEIARSGHLLAGVQLQPTSKATTVRQRGGKRLVTDGPFAQGKEHLAGYYLVECQHLDEAIAMAGRIPGVRLGEAVEIRPLVPMPEFAPPSR
jgi:hypothetical protein